MQEVVYIGIHDWTAADGAVGGVLVDESHRRQINLLTGVRHNILRVRSVQAKIHVIGCLCRSAPQK